MKSITRRAVLKGSSATVAAGAVAVPSLALAGDDAELIRLCRRWHALIDHCNTPGVITDDECDALVVNVICPLEKRIATIPVHSTGGVAAKLEMFKSRLDSGVTSSENDGRLLGTVLDRLAVMGAA